MIKIYELEKELTDVRDDELDLVTGARSYGLDYKVNPTNGVGTGRANVGIGSTNFGYEFNNFAGKNLSEAYSLKTQLSPALSVGVGYEGVSKSVSTNLNYKTDNFNGSVFASPSAIGFSLSGNF